MHAGTVKKMYFSVLHVCHQLNSDLCSFFAANIFRKKIVPGCTTHEKSHLELPVCLGGKNTLSLEKRPKHRNLYAR